MPAYRLHRLAGAIGAEVEGVDLAAADPPLIAELRAHWLDYGMLAFRGQDLTPTMLVAVARKFGEPMEYPFIRGLPEAPQVIPVVKLEHERSNFGGLWHTDTAYLERPPMATLLLARQIPPVGGDTLFAGATAALAGLSDAMRAMLAPLRAVNSSAKADVTKTREDRIRDSARTEAPTTYTAEHPVVRTHPETGRAALYVNFGHTQHFVGMTEAESAPLLHFLFEHQTRPEYTCRLRWAPGTLALWDNRCVLHNPINDYQGHRRAMHRVTLAGDVPR